MEKLNTASSLLLIIESFVSQTPNGKSRFNVLKRKSIVVFAELEFVEQYVIFSQSIGCEIVSDGCRG